MPPRSNASREHTFCSIHVLDVSTRTFGVRPCPGGVLRTRCRPTMRPRARRLAAQFVDSRYGRCRAIIANMDLALSLTKRAGSRCISVRNVRTSAMRALDGGGQRHPPSLVLNLPTVRYVAEQYSCASPRVRRTPVSQPLQPRSLVANCARLRARTRARDRSRTV